MIKDLRRREQRSSTGAFSLIEVMVATAILVVIMMIVVSIIGQISSVWRRSSEDIQAFQNARLGYDLITRNLSQALLNTYLDYDNVTTPTRYLRKSELAFFCGKAGEDDLPGTMGTGQAVFFYAPASYTKSAEMYGGMESLLNTCGYYVTFCQSKSIPGHVSGAANSYRYRLVQLLVPTEEKNIYDSSMVGTHSWFMNYADPSSKMIQAVSDNIIALIIRPQDPASTPADLSEDYKYDTTLKATDDPQPVTAHQLPPVMQVTLVAIDEVSARRMERGSQPPEVIANALGGKFKETANYQNDIDQLESALNAAHIQYRIFSSAVPIRESKWTK